MSPKDMPLSPTVKFVGVACGEGAPDSRCEAGPAALRDLGLLEFLCRHGVDAIWEETLHSDPKQYAAFPMQQIIAMGEELHHHIKHVVSSGDLFAVLGGDHSCAVGTWSGASIALDQQGPLGLIWIDAHMDSHVPQTSPSGAPHGMPLAILLGFGNEELTNMGGKTPKLLPQHVCLIGVRSYEPAEAALLKRLGVRVFFMEEVMQRGLEEVLHEAVALVQQGTGGFGISIDLDAIDPADAPGVGTPEPEGLDGQSLVEALTVMEKDKLIGVEVAEFNPFTDHDQSTAKLVAELLHAMVASQGRNHE